MQLSRSRVIKYSKRNDVCARCDSCQPVCITSQQSRDVSAVIAGWCVIIGVGVVFGKIPATDNSITGAKSFAQCHVIPGHAAIDYCNRLPRSIQARRASLSGSRPKKRKYSRVEGTYEPCMRSVCSRSIMMMSASRMPSVML